MSQVGFMLATYNPDVLSCIANLSNDQVFTPPDLANKVLDSLEQEWATTNSGENIWTNKDLIKSSGLQPDEFDLA